MHIDITLILVRWEQKCKGELILIFICYKPSERELLFSDSSEATGRMNYRNQGLEISVSWNFWTTSLLRSIFSISILRKKNQKHFYFEDWNLRRVVIYDFSIPKWLTTATVTQSFKWHNLDQLSSWSTAESRRLFDQVLVYFW